MASKAPKIEFRHLILGAIVLGAALLILFKGGATSIARDCSSDVNRPCYERESSGADNLQARVSANSKTKLGKEEGEKEFSDCIQSAASSRGVKKENTKVCKTEVVQFCDRKEADDKDKRIKKFEGNCQVAQSSHVHLVTPNNGERFVRGQGPIHISWTGGTGKVWIFFAHAGGVQWQWLSPAAPPWNLIGVSPTTTPPPTVNDYYIQPGTGSLDFGIAKDQPASGSFDWDGMTMCVNPQNTGCQEVLAGIYRIVVVSQENINQPLNFDSIFTSWTTAGNFDDSDVPFMIVTNSSVSSITVDEPSTAGNHWQGNWSTRPNRVTWSLNGYIQDRAQGGAGQNIEGYSKYGGQVYTLNLYKSGSYIASLYNALYPYYWPHSNSWDSTVIPPVPAGNDYTVEVIFHGPTGDVKAMSQPFSFDAP